MGPRFQHWYRSCFYYHPVHFAAVERRQNLKYQRTLASSIACAGIGLHSGHKIKLRILPAAVDTGIVFRRVDLKNSFEIQATAEHVVDTSLNTTLGRSRVLVKTAEHLLAALAGLGIDNAVIELDAPEVPIMDGSAASYIYLLTSAGIRRQNKLQRFIKIHEAIEIKENGRFAAVYPSDVPEITYEIDFNHPMLKVQRLHYRYSEDAFVRDIARARTFGFLKEVEQLQASGYARGGSLDNAIVIGDYRILNPEGLRFPDEFVRHKILDAIGDLSLVGCPIIGHFQAAKSGHALNARLVNRILESPEKWSYVTGSDERTATAPSQEPAAVPRFARASA
jgi:UDP-3-O-[3-hydroxymyristoyl] N-acetylglucosamine deacetylase